MSEEIMKRVAIVMAEAAVLNANIAGMIAMNQQRERQGYALAYDEKAFYDEVKSHHVLTDARGFLDGA